MSRQALAAVMFVAAVATGTVLGARFTPPPPSELVLAADLHVHPFPGDGGLTVEELAREARRRDVDVLAITGHNNQLALRLSGSRGDVIVLPGEEVTTPGFHMIAVGIEESVDWRLSVSDTVAAIHRLGGAAIAAHPVDAAWQPRDVASLAALDGVEVAHPLTAAMPSGRKQIDAFFAAVTAVNPDVAPIGSTDFHMTGPLGRCRTYLLVDERSAAGAIAAIRRGTTVAEDQNGTLRGRPEHVARVEQHRAARSPRPSPSAAERGADVVALLALAIAAYPRRTE